MSLCGRSGAPPTALGYLSGDQPRVNQLLVYLKGSESAMVTQRLHNLIRVNALVPGLDLVRLGVTALTAEDSVLVGALGALSGAELATVRANAGANLSGLFNLRLPSGGGFSGTDLRVAVKVYGTITNAAALTATHMPRWVRAYKAGVRPMRMPGVSWNTGATGLQQHFEKHACGQHANPDPAEPYHWVTYLGYSSTLTKRWVLADWWCRARARDETQLFGSSPASINARIRLSYGSLFLPNFRAEPMHPCSRRW